MRKKKIIISHGGGKKTLAGSGRRLYRCSGSIGSIPRSDSHIGWLASNRRDPRVIHQDYLSQRGTRRENTDSDDAENKQKKLNFSYGIGEKKHSEGEITRLQVTSSKAETSDCLETGGSSSESNT